jgi:prepilin-type N-terminal cleavage/methylation domain-containing protein/prepilin-type processing-associated H-X9-DG protein
MERKQLWICVDMKYIQPEFSAFHAERLLTRCNFRRYNSMRRGFTLIELLVVIAIIALLVSILLPSLTKAKELAKQVVCASNQHQIAMCMIIYADDYDGFLPPSDESMELQLWDVNTLDAVASAGGVFSDGPLPTVKYTDMTDRYSSLFVCPSFEINNYRIWWAYNNVVGIRYKLTTMRGSGGFTDRWYVEPPSRAGQMKVGGSVPFSGVILTDYINFRMGEGFWWGNHVPGGFYHESTGAPANSRSGTNAAYTDGHVEWHGGGDMTPLATDRQDDWWY